MQGACGKAHTVAITTEGKSYAWGMNNMGQCGIGEVKLFIRTTLLSSLSVLIGAWCVPACRPSYAPIRCAAPSRIVFNQGLAIASVCYRARF